MKFPCRSLRIWTAIALTLVTTACMMDEALHARLLTLERPPAAVTQLKVSLDSYPELNDCMKQYAPGAPGAYIAALERRLIQNGFQIVPDSSPEHDIVLKLALQCDDPGPSATPQGSLGSLAMMAAAPAAVSISPQWPRVTMKVLDPDGKTAAVVQQDTMEFAKNQMPLDEFPELTAVQLLNALGRSPKILHLAQAPKTVPPPVAKPQPPQAPRPAMTAGQVHGVAVYPFAAKGGADGSLAEGLSAVFSNEIAAAPCVRIVAEDIIRDLARQQGMEQQCGTESCQIDLAQQAKADILVRGDLAKIGDSFVLTALVVDIVSKQTLLTDKVESSRQELLRQTETLGQRIGAGLACK